MAGRLYTVFPVLQVVSGSAQTTEPRGSKFKFWFTDPDRGLALFKQGRPGAGENWAEKIACELASLLRLPHAVYDLAQYEGKDGVVSLSLVAKGARVVHGNELLAAYATDFVRGNGAHYRNPTHTLRRIFAYFRASGELVGAPYGWAQSARIRTASDFFIGYLMFDAWIANQDRHEENWGILRMNDGNMFFSPSYDHGSSMACNEPDKKRQLRLATRDAGQHISNFVMKARSGLFPTTTDPNPPPLHTVDAFLQACQYSPNAAAEWRERLANVELRQVREIIDEVPIQWMSTTARDFTAELLRLNQERILRAVLT